MDQLVVKVILYELNICLLHVCEVGSLSTGNCDCTSLLLFWDQGGTVTVEEREFIHLHFQKKFNYLLTIL